MKLHTKKTKAVLAAALLSATVLGTSPAYAGPGTAAAVAFGTTEACGFLTLTSSPFGLPLCLPIAILPRLLFSPLP